MAVLGFTFGNKVAQDTGPSVTGIEALTDRLGPEFMPAISPDGRNLAYVARDGENADTDIFLVRVGGSNPVNLTADHDGWDVAPAFSPDGESIAFDSEREGGGIFVMGATGESPRRVASMGTHPDWSPDGKQIVAATEQVYDPYSRNTRSRVFIIDLDGGTPRDLPVGEDGVGPRWAPDGQRILYWSEINGQRDLWTIAVDGDEPTPLTYDAHTDWEPLWAENGQAVYFHSDRGGGIDLWRLPIDPSSGAPAGEPTPLTIGVTPAWESSISADGSRLVVAMRSNGTSLQAYGFDSDRLQVGEPETLLESNVKLLQAHLSHDGGKIAFRSARPRETVFTMDLETGQQRRLLDDGFRNRGPTWSSDGEWIGIYSNRDGLYQVWLMRPEGTDLHRIVEESSSDPYWSPDGTMLSVGVDRGSRWEATQLLRRDPDSASDQTAWTEVGELIPDFAATGWSPDGRLLLGTFSYPPRYFIYDVAAGEILDRSSPSTRSSYEATWFPDSERILYWDQATQHYLVWNWRTGDTSPLPGLNRVQGDPMISPNGRTLYVMEQNVDGEIWMLTLDRGNDAD